MMQYINYVKAVLSNNIIQLYTSSGYSPFSDRVGLPLHNIPSSGVLMKSIGVEFLRPDGLIFILQVALDSSVMHSVELLRESLQYTL